MVKKLNDKYVRYFQWGMRYYWNPHEETKGVKRSKLQMLTSWFEELEIKENETFGEFYIQLCDIVNSSYGLGEKISKIKVIDKILRKLSQRFDSKVTTN